MSLDVELIFSVYCAGNSVRAFPSDKRTRQLIHFQTDKIIDNKYFLQEEALSAYESKDYKTFVDCVRYWFTFLPFYLPSYLPTFLPTFLPSYLSTFLPSYLPTFLPSYLPTFLPSYLPTLLPSPHPSSFYIFILLQETFPLIFPSFYFRGSNFFRFSFFFPPSPSDTLLDIVDRPECSSPQPGVEGTPAFS